MNLFVGREHEISILRHALSGNTPELIAVYGRRRVGKTFLVRHVCSKYMIFEISGLHKARLSDQLDNFSMVLSETSNKKEFEKPESWLEAFKQLQNLLNNQKSIKKKVIFLDEFPWFDTPKSKFLMAFENFWNSYASKRTDLVIIICGSAASYMVQKIIKNKGGLHNRITQRIRLLPFTLKETEKFIHSKNLKFNHYNILQLYMALGGIPFYLDKLQKGESVAQALDRLCFKKDGPLADEFDLVYASLFSKHEKHVSIIRALVKVRKGITRDELSNQCGYKTGGGLTRTMDELIESGFISRYRPFGKKSKEALYRLSDEYSMFYLKYIENNVLEGEGTWQRLSQSNSYISWSGYSFETICLKHIVQIKSALKISAIYSVTSSWTYKSKDGGTQVDLLIDRDDNIINLCEMKFSRDHFTISKRYAEELRRKENTFRKATKTRKNTFITMITTYGLRENSHSLELVANDLKMDVLFE